MALAAFIAAGAIAFWGCSDKTVAPIAPAPTVDASTDECDGQKSRGPSEPCCFAFGVDACGANLFCAAFDGRTQTTCYPNGSRKGTEQCTADGQCASSACREGQCLSMLGEACDPLVGCSQVQASSSAPTACTTSATDTTLQCRPVSVTTCDEGLICPLKEGDVCAVPSASFERPCPAGLACNPDSTTELSRCGTPGTSGKAALYGACTEDKDCGDGTYDGTCVPVTNGGVCGYKACTSDGDCTGGKTCKTCPLSGGKTIKGCVSDSHVGYHGGTCQ
jgi:hypothetical protein